MSDQTRGTTDRAAAGAASPFLRIARVPGGVRIEAAVADLPEHRDRPPAGQRDELPQPRPGERGRGDRHREGGGPGVGRLPAVPGRHGYDVAQDDRPGVQPRIVPQGVPVDRGRLRRGDPRRGAGRGHRCRTARPTPRGAVRRPDRHSWRGSPCPPAAPAPGAGPAPNESSSAVRCEYPPVQPDPPRDDPPVRGVVLREHRPVVPDRRTLGGRGQPRWSVRSRPAAPAAAPGRATPCPAGGADHTPPAAAPARRARTPVIAPNSAPGRRDRGPGRQPCGRRSPPIGRSPRVRSWRARRAADRTAAAPAPGPAVHPLGAALRPLPGGVRARRLPRGPAPR
ncbi:hypothetical protein SCALM49S_08329 [Streptomyces californicus]